MIYFPKVYGLCKGSNDAINLAYSLSSEKNVVILKEILHNQEIINNLESNGINTINGIDEINDDNIVIIRAHGEPKSTYDYLNERNIKYYDATCKNVLRIHKLVIDKYGKGYQILIVGKKNHPEVIGTNGWCNNEAIIVENEDDINFTCKKKIFVVAQTTISKDKYLNIIKILTSKYDIIYEDTICNLQKLIQDNSKSLAKDMDIMFIVGGKSSSNTKELFNVCSEVCKSYFVSDETDLREILNVLSINNNTKIGITGGASTPKSQINNYCEIINEYIV